MATKVWYVNGVPQAYKELTDGAGDWVPVIDPDAITTGPSGGASAANQVIEIARLDSIKAAVESIDAATPDLGQGTMAASVSVAIASDQSPVPVAATAVASEVHVGEMGGKITTVSVEFTRPGDTTAYTANDIVSDNTSASTLMAFANIVRVNAGSGYIVGARLMTDKKSITPRFRVHVYNDSAPTRAADNVAHKSVYADHAKRVADFDLPAMSTPADTTNSDQSSSWDFTLRIPIQAAAGSTTLYILLEALDGFAPAASQKFRLILNVDNN